MADIKLTPAQMAVELGINPLTSIVFTNEPSSQKAKQNDGQEAARTHQHVQVLLRSMTMLSPKDGRPTVKFKSTPQRLERHVTPDKCKGRELGILMEMQTERDADKLVSAWKKAMKKGERRQMVRWPIEKETAASSSSANPPEAVVETASVETAGSDA